MTVTGDERVERITELVKRVVDALGLQAKVDVRDDGETITATVQGEALGLFIGHHGQTIDAVQHLATRIAGADHEAEHRRVVVDAAGYRARRQEALVAQAEDAADEALRFRRPVALDAMTASERKLVHDHLRERDDVETHSEGDEPERHLVITPRP